MGRGKGFERRLHAGKVAARNLAIEIGDVALRIAGLCNRTGDQRGEEDQHCRVILPHGWLQIPVVCLYDPVNRMNRREFNQLLGAGTLVAGVAPALAVERKWYEKLTPGIHLDYHYPE